MWAERWRVKFNPVKLEAVLIFRKNNNSQSPPLKMNDEPIKEVTYHRHLGIFFSNDGIWHQHTDYITSKAEAGTRLNMRKLKFILDRQSLEIIYTSFIRPVLEYTDVVWDYCTQYEINAQEKIQKADAPIATGATELVS